MTGAAVSAVVLAVAGVALARGRQHHPPAASSKPALHVETHARVPSSTQVASATPHPAKRPSDDQPLAILDRLDATRGAAFARRDIGLLGTVYVPGPLLRADTALLERVVPTGCRLVGVRTRYSAAQVVAAGPRVVMSVTARLNPSDLVCGGRRRGHAASVGPMRLRVVLVRTAAGWRLADQYELR